MTFRSTLIVLLFVGLLGSAQAQIGEPPELLLERLPEGAARESGSGYLVADSFAFDLELRNDRVYRVEGEGSMSDTNVNFMAALVGVATDYGDSIAVPVEEFLAGRLGEISGAGPVALGLGSYRLTLDVSRGREPYSLEFVLALGEVEQDLFPEPAQSKGPGDATYVIREFSDFQCPYCAAFASEVLPALEERLLARGDVRIEFHHLPLMSIHPNALPAAEAAECVADASGGDGFWEYHDRLFERQGQWQGLDEPGDYLVGLASELGLRQAEIESCLEAGRFRSKVEAAYRVATGALGLSGTPTVFLNGYRVEDWSDPQAYLELMDLVDAFAVE